MKTIKAEYGGFEIEQDVDEAIYDAIYKNAVNECLEIVKAQANQYDGIWWAIRELEELKAKGE